MFYKLSNTCKLEVIEREFHMKFRYPNLYEPKAMINGLGETNLPIITSETPNEINFAIWGILPEAYDDNWDTFQDVTNTLNTNIDDAHLNEEIYSKTLDKRRCLIIVNGFFTSKLRRGKLDMHHVHLKDYKPFCIAGVYNTIDDGFLTCSVLVTNSGLEYTGIPNLGKQQPLIFKKKDYKSWLNSNLEFKDLEALTKSHDLYNFKSHPVKEAFYDNTKVYRLIINSNHYKSVMRIAGN
jgi:putative SOS response-associated peptidase YedK